MAERLVATSVITRPQVGPNSLDLAFMPSSLRTQLLNEPPAEVPNKFNGETDLGIIVNKSILPDLMKVGIAKAQGIPRTDPIIIDNDKKTISEVSELIGDSEGTKVGDRIDTYHALLQGYMDGKTSLDPMREFVAETFNPVFNGKDQFVEDLKTFGKGLVIATHNTHTPEIDVIDWENGKIVHDTGPVVTRIAMDAALKDTDITVSRLTRSPQPSEFYQTVMADLGNVILSEGGIGEVSKQLQDVVSKGELPALSPEGGFRVLEKWNTGPIVLAVKSGLTHVHLVAHSPLVSLFDPQMSFDYAGTLEIPQEVRDAVVNGEKGPVVEFSNKVRAEMANAIQESSYPETYKDHAAKFATL